MDKLGVLIASLAVAAQVEVAIVLPDAPHSDAPVVAALFAKAENFNARTDPLHSIVLKPDEGALTWRLTLPPGDYAMLAYQDLNGNGDFDLDSGGRPLEPYTVSGRSARRAPLFKRAVVAVNGEKPVEMLPWRQQKRQQKKNN